MIGRFRGNLYWNIWKDWKLENKGSGSLYCWGFKNGEGDSWKSDFLFGMRKIYIWGLL